MYGKCLMFLTDKNKLYEQGGRKKRMSLQTVDKINVDFNVNLLAGILWKADEVENAICARGIQTITLQCVYEVCT